MDFVVPRPASDRKVSRSNGSSNSPLMPASLSPAACAPPSERLGARTLDLRHCNGSAPYALARLRPRQPAANPDYELVEGMLSVMYITDLVRSLICYVYV